MKVWKAFLSKHFSGENCILGWLEVIIFYLLPSYESNALGENSLFSEFFAHLTTEGILWVLPYLCMALEPSVSFKRTSFIGSYFLRKSWSGCPPSPKKKKERKEKLKQALVIRLAQDNLESLITLRKLTRKHHRI